MGSEPIDEKGYFSIDLICTLITTVRKHKLENTFDKKIQSCVGEMAGRGPKLGKVGVYLACCMVVPVCDAVDR